MSALSFGKNDFLPKERACASRPRGGTERFRTGRVRGKFRRLRAAGRRPTPFLLFPFERENAVSDFPKRERGLLQHCAPKTRKLNCPLNVPAPPARHFLMLKCLLRTLFQRTREQSPSLCAAGPAGCGHTRKVSAAEDKQRIERRTATIGFMKSSAKREVLKPWFQAAFW